MVQEVWYSQINIYKILSTNTMNLILLIVIGFFLWLGYALYGAYKGIVNELKEMRTKCIGTNSEKFESSVKETPVEDEISKIPGSMVKGLGLLMKML